MLCLSLKRTLTEKNASKKHFPETFSDGPFDIFIEPIEWAPHCNEAHVQSPPNKSSTDWHINRFVGFKQSLKAEIAGLRSTNLTGIKLKGAEHGVLCDHMIPVGSFVFGWYWNLSKFFCCIISSRQINSTQTPASLFLIKHQRFLYRSITLVFILPPYSSRAETRFLLMYKHHHFDNTDREIAPCTVFEMFATAAS